MKLILEISDSAGGAPLHRVVEKFPVTLGRGYHNDIILSDPHVGDKHLSIDFDGQAWTLTDLGSVNPTVVNAKAHRSISAPLKSGDVLHLGSTTLRILSPDHPVAPAVPMHRMHPLFLLVTHPRLSWVFTLLAMLSAAAWAYAGKWTPDDDLSLSVGATVAAAFVVVLVWGAVWALSGKLSRGKPFFGAHVALASLYLACSVVLAFAGGYLDFLLNGGLFATLLSALLEAATFALLLYGSFTLATRMARQKRAVLAAFFSSGIILGILAVNVIASQKFDPDPGYPYHLEPFLSGLPSVQTAEGFMAENEKVFSSDEFNQPAPGK